MNFIIRIILASSFLLLFSLLSAGEKSVKKDHFLSISSNNKNMKLRAELENLRLDFDVERQKIQEYYAKEIEKIKKEKQLEIRAIKQQFGKKREALEKKYGEEQKEIQLIPDNTIPTVKQNRVKKKSSQSPK